MGKQQSLATPSKSNGIHTPRCTAEPATHQLWLQQRQPAIKAVIYERWTAWHLDPPLPHMPAHFHEPTPTKTDPHWRPTNTRFYNKVGCSSIIWEPGKIHGHLLDAVCCGVARRAGIGITWDEGSPPATTGEYKQMRCCAHMRSMNRSLKLNIIYIKILINTYINSYRFARFGVRHFET